jgi:hypothetical protein
MARASTDSDAGTRARLAIVIVSLSVVGIATASIVSIAFATDAGRPEAARLVFASALPLLGTWVGTVLAFYFVRENLQAATESTLRLTERLEPSTPVREAMIAMDEVDAVRLKPGDDPQQLKLSAIHAEMSTKKRRRMPIQHDSGAVRYVIHESTLAAYANSKGRQLSALTDQDTIATLRQDDGLKKAIEAIGFVRPDASLGEARAVMRSVEDCNDVFVTKNGKKDDPAVGWLTNTLLAGVE